MGIFYVSLLLAAHGQPPPSPIQAFAWTGTQYSGFDPFYSAAVFGGSAVKAYRIGSAASLTLTVSNIFDTTIYVTAVKASMDWGKNYTLSLSPATRIDKSNSTSFTVTFTVPNTSEASNLVVHTYKIIVEYTTTPGGTTSAIIAPEPFGPPPPPFVVYSADQADAMALMNKLGLPAFPGVTTTQFCGFQFKTAEGTSLCLQSSREAIAGLNLYTNGDFAGAKTRLQKANDLMDQAIAVDSSRGSSTELASTLGSWGGLLLGIGAIIGVAIYALRSRREARPVSPGSPTMTPTTSA